MSKRRKVEPDDPSINITRSKTLQMANVDIQKQMHNLHRMTDQLDVCHKEINGEHEYH